MTATMRRTSVMAIVVFIASIVIWRIAIWLSQNLDVSFFRHQQFIFALSVCSATLLLITVMLRIHRKNFQWLGLQNTKNLVIGLLSYLIPASITLLIAIFTGFIRITLTVSWPQLFTSICLVALLVFLAEALPEELLFRGYFWALFAGKTPVWLLLIIQMLFFVIFAALIGAVSDPLDASFLASFAIVLGIVRRATHSLWGAIGFHLAFMTSQQALGSSWNLISTPQHSQLQMLILSMIPFSLCIMYYASRFSWLSETA